MLGNQATTVKGEGKCDIHDTKMAKGVWNHVDNTKEMR